MKQLLILLSVTLLCAACGDKHKKSADAADDALVAQQFSADSAFTFCQQQCDFGPRTMNSEAHEQCGQWIMDKFRSYGLEVSEQRATLTGFDGTPLQSNNITAHYQPELQQRILICAHWDSRPWADNDPDEANHQKPVLDFVCFDAEDWGTEHQSDSWALGAQYWAKNIHKELNGKTYRYGILLDMVGGQGARFYQEGVSLLYAKNVVDRVWKAATIAGYSSMFPQADGGTITDDHVPVNQAGIPCIDIIPCYPDCEQSNFGPTWHTISDDMDHIDPATLKAVGQTLLQVLFTEE